MPAGTGKLEGAFATQTEPGQREPRSITTMLVDGVRYQRIDPLRIFGLPPTHLAELRAYNQEARHERCPVLCVPAG